MSAKTRIIRLLLSLVLGYAALGKLLGEPEEGTIYSESAEWVKATLPFVELGSAIALLTGILPRVGAASALVAFSIFSGVIVAELRREQPRPCGCFGSAAIEEADAIRSSLRWALARNAILVGAAGYLYLSVKGTGRETRDTSPAGPVWPMPDEGEDQHHVAD